MYKLLVTAKEDNMLSGIEKNDGSKFSSNERNITFIVTSQYSDRFWVEDFLKQNSLKRIPGCSFPGGWLYASNGWSIQQI